MSTLAKNNTKKPTRKAWLFIVPAGLLAAICVAFFIYTGNYYRADSYALSQLESSETVTVSKTEYGWLFDGPSESDALIFYPGAKVEETAYAPLMHRLAAEGMDVCLVKMPFHLAFFGMNEATDIIAYYEASADYHYENWYLGGHSLGGAMAAVYAAGEETQGGAAAAGQAEASGAAADSAPHLTGLILLAAYPTKPLRDDLQVITIYGSEDGVLNMAKIEEGKQYLPTGSELYELAGGNHAQFGNYGPQRGDGEASISAEEQQKKTVELILEMR